MGKRREGNVVYTVYLTLPTRKASNGTLLPSTLRSQFEGRFGHNFAQVRVHPDDPSVEAQHADAVTRGWQVSFAPGRWNPESLIGQRLLTHELAHVVQQTQTGPPIRPHEAERQADHTATRLSTGASAPQLGAVPFGTTAAQPQAAQPQPGQPQIVPAALVEKLAADIERVVKSADLPGINDSEIAGVVAVLREYGNTGRVVWGDTDGAYGTYDHESDLITLSDQRFDINNPGPVATLSDSHKFCSLLLEERDLALFEQRMESLVSRLRAAPNLLANAQANLSEEMSGVLATTALQQINGALPFLRSAILEYAETMPALEAGAYPEDSRAGL